MSTLKTLPTSASPEDFINQLPAGPKKTDALKLLQLFTQITGEQPKMWGSSIIGFGQYHYKSERSRQEGDWPLTGFSPRKQNLTLYIGLHATSYPEHLKKLGKHKTGVGCLYINKLADVDLTVLKDLIKTSSTPRKDYFKGLGRL